MSDDMRSLSQTFRESLARGETIIAPVAARALLLEIQANGFEGLKAGPTLLELIDAPGTQQARMSLETAQKRLIELSASPVTYRTEIARTRREIEAYIVRYARALERDELAAGRPVGCWCLGYGGREPHYLPMPTEGTITGTDGVVVAEIEEVEILRVYCESCPEGEARAEYDSDRLLAYNDVVSRQAVIRRFGDANLPLEYRRHPWRDHPDRRAVRKVLEWIEATEAPCNVKTGCDRQHWLLLYGPGGRGKTTIMAGLAAELAEAGASVLFRTTPDLIADVRATFGKADEQEKLRAILKRVRHLFLDDLGADVPRDWIGELFYEVLNHRHNEHLPTYISTNLWDERTGLAPLIEHLGVRMWGRFKRMAVPVLMNDQDLRDR